MASAYAKPVVFSRIMGDECFTTDTHNWDRLYKKLKRYVIGCYSGEYQLCWDGHNILLRITDRTVAIYSGNITTHLTSPSYEEFWSELVNCMKQLEAEPVKQPTNEEIIAYLMRTQG